MKQLLRSCLLIACAGSLITGCNNDHANTTGNQQSHTDTLDIPALKKVIAEKSRRFTQAHITGDTAFLNNIFTSDARVLAPNTDPISGRSAIAAINLEYIGFGITAFSEETTNLYGSGGYLIDEGNYTMTYGKDSTVEKGKYINIWMLENKDWKLYANIWNSSMPAAPVK